MEAKLAEYRARKSKDLISDSDSRFKKLLTVLFSTFNAKQKLDGQHSSENTPPPASSGKHPNTPEKEVNETLHVLETSKTPTSPFSWLLLLLKILLWLTLWKIFIELQFGAVFFAVSGLLFIYFSTRTESSKTLTLSAYSVFNPNCERLQGTITAEQFERELFHRSTLQHSDS